MEHRWLMWISHIYLPTYSMTQEYCGCQLKKKKLILGLVYLLSNRWSESQLETHQTINIIATGLDCPPKSVGKTLLLKIAHKWKQQETTGHENIKLVLTGKLPTCWLTFIVPKMSFRLLGWKVSNILTQTWILWATIMISLAQYSHGYKSDMYILG